MQNINMKNKFLNILQNDFNFQRNSAEKNKILVGVSGGSDSIFLLYLLNLVKTEFNLEIYVVHINHNLRAKESDDDAIFVENFCKKLDIFCIVKNIKITGKTGIEQKARETRYKIFNNICKEYGIKCCALAHNSDDNIETVLMWLIRGTGLSGAEGIPKTRFLYSDTEIILIRPILSFFKTEILEFLNKNKILFREDSSNKSNKFFRNKLRNELVPILEKYNSKFKNHILNFSGIIAENNIFVDDILDEYLKNVIVNFSDKNNENIVIDLKKYIGYNEACQKKILSYVLKDKSNFKHVIKLYELIKKNKNFEMPLKAGFVVTKEYNFLTIKKIELQPKNKFDFEELNEEFRRLRSFALLRTTDNDRTTDNKEILKNNKIEMKIFEIKNISEITNLKDKNFVFFDYFLFEKLEKLENKNLEFRNRKNGDIFKPFGMTNYKKLKDFFIDEKISASARNKIILLADKNEILWIVGYRTSENFKITNETKKVLRLRLKIKNN